MFKKISMGKIISHHIKTLVNSNTNKIGMDDVVTFLVVPIVLAGILTWFRIALSDSAVTIVITALSIFVGLLFNVVVLIFDLLNRDSSKRLKNAILKQLLANISFTILLSILIILLCLDTLAKGAMLLAIIHAVIYFMLAVFLFTVLMILKRMYALFRNEIIEIEQNSPAV